MISPLLPPTLVGLLGFALLLASMIASFLLLLPFALIKLAVPYAPLQRACTEGMFGVVRLWGDFNAFICRVLYPLQWEIEINGRLDPARSYLLLSNHQSWIDILLLVHVFRHRVPPVCFFLKRELIWVPIIGFACWAMDFPFMKRHSREAVARNPALALEDLAATRAACEKFREHPATVINFAEGTRGSAAKRAQKRSPYRHLLRPKAAGMAYALEAMGEQFAGVIDVTIGYRPTRAVPLWSFLAGEQNQLAIRVDVLPVPAELLHGDYRNDPEYRARIQNWINTRWEKKDAWLDKWLAGPEPAIRPYLT